MKRLLLFISITTSFGASQAQNLTKNETREIVHKVRQLIRKHYVIPDLAKQIDQQLQENFQANKYQSLNNYAQLAKAITTDLQSLTQDGHLYLKYNKGYQKNTQKPKRRRGAQGHGGHGPTDEMFNRFRNKQGKFFEAKVLEGNIGYLNIPVFPSLHLCQQEIEAAMKKLSQCEALIFDVQSCPGGEGESMTFLAGYLFAQRTKLNYYFRKKQPKRTSYTRKVPGKTMPKIPVYILTSKKTFSAGESFAFYLQQLNRAKIVGIKTRGGGRANMLFTLNPELMLSVSVSRSISAVTGKGFQGVGVVPDIPTEASKAKKIAQLNALMYIIQQNPSKKTQLSPFIKKLKN